MKEKTFLRTVTILVLLLMLIICILKPNGKTLESREEILKNSNAGKYVWEIDKEIKLYDYIISSVYGDKEGLATFISNSNGRNKLESVNYSSKGEVIITQIIHEEEVYYITWCNQPNLDYAEVIYTIDNEELMPKIYDVKENSLIYFKSPGDDFMMRITYYDENGKSYD